jgi:hypothetical protein
MSHTSCLTDHLFYNFQKQNKKTNKFSLNVYMNSALYMACSERDSLARMVPALQEQISMREDDVKRKDAEIVKLQEQLRTNAQVV